jgi:transitional endoplasmic reticulum ATPase
LRKLQTESYDLVVLAATNRPDMLDQALLRPGRLDRLLYLPLPTFEDRKKIFKVHLGQEYLRDDVDISILARDTDGFSGADIAALCQEARYIALEKDINASEVSIANFLQAMKRVFPTASRLDPQLVAAYKKFKRNIDF